MFKTALATTAVVVCAAGYAFAQGARATFILTDGERKSGTIVAHGSDHENLINGYLNLGQQNDKDLTFPQSQVAVIDFVGGQPPSSELQALPSGTGDMLALRNGSNLKGQLANLVNGDTVLWRNQAGQTQRYAISDVKRIYLNPESARTAYNYTPSDAAGASAGQATPGAVQVLANQAWTPTGVMVKKGDRVTFDASGQIQFGQGSGMTTGPGGGTLRNGAYPVPAASVGALIAKVGASTPFPIGTNSQPIVMPASGQLMLGVNDNEVNDNSGSFSVVVRKVG